MKKKFELFLICFAWLLCFVVVGTLFFTTACSTAPRPASPCLNLAPGESVICDITGNPQDLDFLLKLANVGALKQNIYKAQTALMVVDGLTRLVEDNGLTYDKLISEVGKRVDPVLFVVLSEYQLDFAAVTLPITAYDRAMILSHLNKQRALILMAMEAYGN